MKKTNLLLLAIILITSCGLHAQVAINTDGTDADSSAMLDVRSTDKGMLVPRMTAAERDSIASPASGLLVYVSDDSNFYFYNGIVWGKLGGASDGDWIINGNNMSSSVAGNVGINQPNPAQKLDVNGTVKGNNFLGDGSNLTFDANSNMQPSLGINYIIALYGTYPSQNKGVDPYIGEIIMFAGNFAPTGWAFCNGQLLSIASNTALFSILGTTYGGDGEVTFALPDLRGRVPVQQGTGPGLTTRNLGQKFGVERVNQ